MMIEIVHLLNVVCISYKLVNYVFILFYIKLIARSSRGDESSSEYSQRRSYSSSGVEEKPTSSQLNRPITSGSTSTIPKTSSETEADIKKRSRSFVRPQLRSAVPDSQFLSIARRPVQSGQRNQKKI